MWYGINVVVVVVIFISGFRIMLYFGGRVGKGIYFVLENSKLVGYGEMLFRVKFWAGMEILRRI